LLALLSSSVDKLNPGMKGANIANYVDFKEFVKNEQGKI
jgi:hypothetical protein